LSWGLDVETPTLGDDSIHDKGSSTTWLFWLLKVEYTVGLTLILMGRTFPKMLGEDRRSQMQ
jgi:hypothetical protein